MADKFIEAMAFPFAGVIAFVHGWLFSDDSHSFYLGVLFLFFSLLLSLAVLVTEKPNRTEESEEVEDPNGILQDPS